MTTIPADILEIADGLAQMRGDSDQSFYDRRDDIAAALMAERERCITPTIEKGVPLRIRRNNYQWREMEVGDSFMAYGRSLPAMQARACDASARVGEGRRYLCKAIAPKAVRVWRIA